FSSRRRHTRFSRDWSSDVCSSDLHARITQLSEEHGVIEGLSRGELPIGERVAIIPNHACLVSNLHDYLIAIRAGTVEAVWRVARSEERRVGKGGRLEWRAGRRPE